MTVLGDVAVFLTLRHLNLFFYMIYYDISHSNTPLPQICYPAEFVRSRSNGTSVITEIHPNNLTLTSHLSKSLKVIATDTDRSLTFHSNHRPSLYPFQDIERYWPKIAKFSTQPLFNDPTDWVLLGIG